MTYLAAVLAAAISFLLGLYLGRKAHPESEEYGVQGVDPYPSGLLEFIADWAHDCADGDTVFGFADIEARARDALGRRRGAPADLHYPTMTHAEVALSAAAGGVG